VLVSFYANSSKVAMTYTVSIASESTKIKGRSKVVITQMPVPVQKDFVKINSGTFTMGSPSTEAGRSANEGPQHDVTLSDFYMSKHEVTQGEYLDVMLNWPGTAPSDTYGLGDNYPAYFVSWLDAVTYCNARSTQEGRTQAYTITGTTVTLVPEATGYRLPTEAEWEYACRAGTTTPWNTGASISTTQANYGNSVGKSTVVGSYDANSEGLYDMHGNVSEWCWDWYGAYTSDPKTNPMGPGSGNFRMERGGDWNDPAQYIRSAYRNNSPPDSRFPLVGFRVVRRSAE
jgi:formylglycine-generating enzyme required for sulfatase activity